MSYSSNNSLSNGSMSSVSSLDEEVTCEFIGQVLNARYLVLDYIDHGTFCRVYMAYDIQCDKFYALKIMNIDAQLEGKTEIIYLKKFISSHRIIMIYDDFIHQEHICMVLELMGLAVIDLINSIDATHHRFTEVVKKVIRDTSTGISELNRKLLIHTDLKLENIMTDILTEKQTKIMKTVQDINVQECRRIFYNKKIENNSFNWLGTDTKNKLRDEFNTYISKVVLDSLKPINESECDNEFEIPDYFICKIIDLGNAEQYFKNTKILKGTIHIRCYRPPENFKTEKYDVMSDIWTFGCLIFEMLFNEKFLDPDVSTEDYVDYIIEKVDGLPQYISEECLLVNFKNDCERDEFCEFIVNTLKIDPRERWNIKDCINSKLLA